MMSCFTGQGKTKSCLCMTLRHIEKWSYFSYDKDKGKSFLAADVWSFDVSR